MLPDELELLFFAMLVLLPISIAARWLISRRSGEKDIPRTSYIFNEDGSVKWPTSVEQEERQDEDSLWPERDFSGELGKPRWTDGGVAHRQSRDPAYTCYTPWHGESKQDFKVHKLQCDNCGSPLTVIDGKRLAACTFCNSQYYLENFDPELEDYPPPRKTSWSTYWVDGGVSIRSIWKEKHD